MADIKTRLALLRNERQLTVGAVGCDHATISAALIAAAALVPAPSAAAPVEVVVEPGAYVESLTMASYVRVIGRVEGATTITGQVTFPAGCDEGGLDSCKVVATNQPAVVVSAPGQSNDVYHCYLESNWNVATGVVRSTLQVTGGRLHIYGSTKVDLTDTDATNNGTTAYRCAIYTSGADAAELDMEDCHGEVHTANLNADVAVHLHIGTNAASHHRKERCHFDLDLTGGPGAHLNAVSIVLAAGGAGRLACTFNHVDVFPTNAQAALAGVMLGRCVNSPGACLVYCEHNSLHKNSNVSDADVYTGQSSGGANDTYRGNLNTYELSTATSAVPWRYGAATGNFTGNAVSSFGAQRTTNEVVIQNGQILVERLVTIVNGATYAGLPTATAGFGEVMSTNGTHHANFTWTPTAAPTLYNATADVSANDVPNKLCIIDGGTQVVLKNRLAVGDVTLMMKLSFRE